MKTFLLWDYTAICEWKNRKWGFKHTAVLQKDWVDIAEAKALRCNRTWERYEYESVLLSVASVAIKLWMVTKEEWENIIGIIKQ